MGLSARDESFRVGVRLGWLCLPLRESRTGRWVCPHKYRELGAAPFSVEVWERLWDGYDNATGMGALWPSDVVQVEADTGAGEEWIRKRKPPRTPTFSSRRGPHYLFRGTGGSLNARPADGVEVLSRDTGKRMLVLPPTPPKSWFPSLSPWDVDLVPLPPAFALRVSANGKRRKASVRGARGIPPGEAHDEMVSMLGRLGRVLSAEELSALAATLNEGRLPQEELAKIVEHVLEKEGDAGRYFDKREGFLPAILAEEVREAYGVRRGAGGHLYWYRDGVFAFDGRERVEGVCARVLGDRFKPQHGRAVVDTLRAGTVEIPDEPNRDLLNVRNGMLDWRTADLRPHSLEHLSITQIPVAWDPDAVCPEVDAFLAEVLPADAQQFTREVFGYGLLPSAALRKAFMLLGSGDNGKTTTLALYRRLLGRRNVSSVPLQAFGESRFAAAEVYGKLANVCGDLDSRALRRSDLFKTITGGTDAVMAERKYEHPFSFVPYATLLFSANEAPASSDQSDAFFARWMVLPFPRRFEGAEVDPHLLDKLTTRSELEGLLVQAVSGLMDLMERGRFDLPASVVAANEEYRSKVDTVATFLAEACQVGVRTSIKRAALYEAYREWCGRNGRMPVSQQSFAPRVRQLLRHEIAAGAVEESASASVGRPWRGIGLRA